MLHSCNSLDVIEVASFASSHSACQHWYPKVVGTLEEERIPLRLKMAPPEQKRPPKAQLVYENDAVQAAIDSLAKGSKKK